VRADFAEELSFPGFPDQFPRVLQALDRRVGRGPELTEADEFSNPSSYVNSLIVDLDRTALTLTPTALDNYQQIDIEITHIEGERILDVAVESDTLIDPGDGLWDDDYTREISYGPHSIHIVYAVADFSDSFNRLVFSTGTAVFAITAPEPDAAWLGCAALAALAARKLRRG